MKSYIFSAAIALFLLFGSCAETFAQKDFKVLSYNVLTGFRQDTLVFNEYFEWVKAIDPDVVAYQEMNGFTQKSLEKFAAKYNHPYAIQSKEEGHPVALSSKYPILNVKRVVDNMWHAFIYAKINGVHVFVIHFSPFNYKKKKEEVRNVLAHAAEIPANEKILIMGDFNSVSKRDAAEYSEAMLKGMQEREKKEAHIRNLNNGQIDYSVTGDVEAAGFKDTFWLSNKKFVYSIPTPKYGSGNHKRIDFMFANPVIAKEVKSSVIIHDNHTDTMSDHYPVLVTFGLK